MATRPVSRTKGRAMADAGLYVGGSALLFTNAGAPTNAVTGKDAAGIGSLCTDITNGKLYINTGTMASPTWTIVGTQS